MNKQDSQSNYFTEEVLDQIKDMSSPEMEDLLKELETSKYWIAIMKYLHSRQSLAQNALYTLDPFKDQTAMARHQGMLLGLADLQEMVMLVKRKSEETNPKTE